MILITGAFGFIGSNLVEYLLEKKEDLILMERRPHTKIGNGRYKDVIADIRDLQAVKECVKKCDGIIHLAGILGTHETMEHPRETVEVNTIGALNIFQAVKEYGKRCVYLTLGDDEWLSPYMITKGAAARFALMYNREYNTDIRIVRALNVYGPRQHWYPVQKAIPTFISRALRNEEIPIFGDGKQHIDLIYVRDTAEILYGVLNAEHFPKQVSRSDYVDAGTGNPTKVIDAANLILTLTDSKSEIKYYPMRRGESDVNTEKAIANIDRVTDLGLAPKTDLLTGMEQTIKWYEKALKDGWE